MTLIFLEVSWTLIVCHLLELFLTIILFKLQHHVEMTYLLNLPQRGNEHVYLKYEVCLVQIALSIRLHIDLIFLFQYPQGAHRFILIISSNQKKMKTVLPPPCTSTYFKFRIDINMIVPGLKSFQKRYPKPHQHQTQTLLHPCYDCLFQ